MQKLGFNCTESSSRGTVQVARSESPARVGNTFRSGWSRPVQVRPPLSFIPQMMSSTSSSSSAPCVGRVSSCPVDCSSAQSRSSFSDMVAATLAGRRLSRPQLASQEISGAGSGIGPDTIDGDSDACVSARSASASTEAAGFTPELEAGPRHEGWLSKRTSARIAGRWQRRYFTLEGCVLRYHHQPGGPAKRSFDIRRARRIGAAAGQTREIELDFGFRVWRLRADSVEAARRWLLLLDTGRLLAGIPEGSSVDQEQWSDDDTGSSCSTAESLASGEPGTPNFASRSAVPSVLNCTAPAQPKKSPAMSLSPWSTSVASTARAAAPPPSIAERLEVDPAKLDKNFEEWFFPPGGPIGSKPSSQIILDGLSKAMDGLWLALGASEKQGGCTAILAVLLRQPRQEAEAVAEGIEAVLGEYLNRMLLNTQRWLQNDDPDADEVAYVARWFLKEARPQLERFESAMGTVAGRVLDQWRSIAETAERLLLSEWESLRCDEVARQCEAWPCNSGAAVIVLQEVLAQVTAWRDHSTAGDRATSVLIAALNALLRSFRRSLGPVARARLCSENLQLAPASRRSSGTKERIEEALRKLGRRALSRTRTGTTEPVPAAAELVKAADEAAAVSKFCTEAKSLLTSSNEMTGAMRTELLAAFAAAFERECSSLCLLLAEAHFESKARELRGISFRGISSWREGVLATSCSAADNFLSETTADASTMCRRFAGSAVLHVMAKRWVRKFKQAPLRFARPELPKAAAADEERLDQFAGRWGCQDAWLTSPLRSSMMEATQSSRPDEAAGNR